MHYIYIITNLIDGKQYIGQTINPKKRFSDHCSTNANTAIHKAIKKYGKENFKMEIIEEIEDDQETNEREIYWIAHYDTFKNGYNSHIGGNVQSGENNPMYGRRGENCPNHKLTMLDGYNLYKSYEYNKNIDIKLWSKYCGINTTTLYQILKGKHFSTMGFPNLLSPEYQAERNKIDEFMLMNIKRDIANRINLEIIASKYKISKNEIKRIKTQVKEYYVDPNGNTKGDFIDLYKCFKYSKKTHIEFYKEHETALKEHHICYNTFMSIIQKKHWATKNLLEDL